MTAPVLPGFYPTPEPFPPSSGVTVPTKLASMAAADAIAPTAGTLRAAVLAYIVKCGETGATDDEMQAALGLAGNTQTPRGWELFKADQIRAVGHRENRRGRKCTVWVAK